MFQDPNLKWSEIKAFCYGTEIRLMVHQFIALWYHSAGIEQIAILLCRDPNGRHPDIVFFDTDIQATSQQIIERYGARWSIEITNRETKQLLGAADPQCRKEQSVMRAPMFAYWSYSFVVLWFVRQYSTAKNLIADPAPWYRKKKSFAFSDMLAAARRSYFFVPISSEAPKINKLPKFNMPRYTRDFKRSGIAKL
jgi:hypothetical protein